METGRIEANGISIDPKHYLPAERDYALWPCFIYQRLGVTLDSRLKRFGISFILSLIEFLLGLALAASIGFAGTYVSTIPVYILCISFGFFMGRVETLILQVPTQITTLRLVFDVPDGEFKREASRVGRRATNRWISIPLTLLVLALAFGAIADYYLIREPVITPAVAAFVAPSFPAAWHLGANLWIKMFILDLLVGLALVLLIPVIYVGGVVAIHTRLLVKRWPVLPMPSYVVTALQPVAEYVRWASTYFAIALSVLVLLYAPRTDRVFIAILLFFSLLGVLGVMFPFLGLRMLLGKARQQLSMGIAVSYYRDIWPVGNGTVLAPDDPLREQQYSRYGRLFQLEELMHEATQATGIVQQLNYLISGIVIQLAPTLLALIIVAIVAHDRIVGIFVR